MKGRDLKQIMDRFELTQQALADQLGVARNTVNRWANDLEPIPDAIEIAVKSLKLSAKKGKTMPLDLRKRKPVVCPDTLRRYLRIIDVNEVRLLAHPRGSGYTAIDRKSLTLPARIVRSVMSADACI
jgi:transcriptional regulator with XRE-family HTH domain